MVETHRFKLGDFNCIAINDGNLTMGPSKIFYEGATEAELNAALAKHGLSPEHLVIPCTILLIDTGEHRVLIDCGAGSVNIAEYPDIGHLLEGLAQENIVIDSITHVLISHGHFDHMAGAVDRDNNPTFPNARYVIAKGEYDYWTSPEAKAPGTGKRLKALQSQLDFIKPDADVVPGIRALATPGHTYHHISVQVTSGDAVMVCTIDTLDNPIHVENPDWLPEWDDDKAQSKISRRRILEMTADKDILVHGFHFPFPGLGYFKRDGEVWSWEDKA